MNRLPWRWPLVLSRRRYRRVRGPHCPHSFLDKGRNLETTVPEVDRGFEMTLPSEMQDKLGRFRRRDSRKAVIADMELLARFQKTELIVPSFLEAGPRVQLKFDPRDVHAAIVTTGGLAPGLHCVIHSIVKRHHDMRARLVAQQVQAL